MAEFESRESGKYKGLKYRVMGLALSLSSRGNKQIREGIMGEIVDEANSHDGELSSAKQWWMGLLSRDSQIEVQNRIRNASGFSNQGGQNNV